MKLLSSLIVIAAFAALAGCDGDSISPLSGSSSGTAASTAAKPTINFQVSPATVTAGQKVTLQWIASHSQSCAASGGWSGVQPTSGTLAMVTPATNTSYTLTCTGQGGSAAQSASVTVNPAAPSITLSANPTTVAAQGVATLTWTATDAKACVASGGWQGPLATSGRWTTEKLTSTTEYEVACTGPGGTTTQSTTITVSPQAPTVTIHANPSTVALGGSSVISWSGQNATACSAAGAWSGQRASSGSMTTGPLDTSSTFTLTCSGPGGSASQSATVSIAAQAPSVVLSANPSTVISGSSSALSWSSTNATACTASGAWSGNEPVKGSQAIGPLHASATYTLTCSGPGGTATQNATVSVKSPAPTLTLSVGPSAVASGGSATLTWSSLNAASCSASGGWSGAKGVSGTQSTGALSSTTTYILTCTGAGGSATQSATVSIKTSPQAPTVALSASPSTITSGSSAVLTWSSQNSTACSASNGWSGSKSLSGSQSTGTLKSNTTFTLTCSGAGGSATQSASVSVSSPVPAPTVTLSASPSTVASGASSTLSWSSTNATSCAASGSWSGNVATSGLQSTGALKASATYVLTCTGAGGSAAQSATVTVSAPAPTVTLSASPSTLTSGASSTLTWSSTNAASCTAGGAWSGAKSTSGSQSTGALTTSSTYTLTCSGPGGNAAQSATVSVSAPAPSVSLAATPTVVKSGSTSMLSWSSTNATACAASGGWSGNQATSGSMSTPALTAATKYMLTCSGTGGSAAQSVTVSVSTPAPTVALSANPTNVSSGGTSTLTWSSTNAASCTASGGWSGALATSGTQATAALSASTSFTVNCTGSGGSASQAVTVSVAPTGGQAQRPSYNTGPGFFVLNGQLYDANGNEFRMRGVDRTHYDSDSQAGIAKSGANTVRIFVGTQYGESVAGLVNIVQTQHIDEKEIPIPTSSATNSGTATSCSSDTGVLNSVVANWVATASSWTALDKYQIINIANEWGPSNSTVWRDSYISAIASMRAAGYLGTLLIDTGGCGQDPNDLMNYAAAVFNSDPQKNVMFAFHFYGLASGFSTVAQMDTIFSGLAALRSQGIVVAITEFGPGRDIGPSPTMVTPLQVIAAAEANNLGWVAWAWDDNDLAGCKSDNNWFSMTYNCGVYTQTSDLTDYGQQVVLDPTYGISVLAQPASIFD